MAEGLNLPVVTQGKDLDEVVANVKEAVELHLSGESAADSDFTKNSRGEKRNTRKII